MFDLDHLVQEFRHAARSLLRYPVSCAVAVISLALGIGATTATLTIRDVVFRKPPGLYRNPMELSRVQVGSPDRPIRGGAGSPVPRPLYEIWRAGDVGGTVAAASAATARPVRAARSTTVPYLAVGPLEPVAADRADAPPIRAERGAIDPDFFATLDVPLRAGRSFTAADGAGTRTAMVNETLASRLFADANPTGRSVWLRGVAYEIVGVVADYKNTGLQNHLWDPKLFLPLDGERSATRAEFLIRTSGDPNALVRELRTAIPAVAAGNAIANAATVDQIIAVGGQEILVGTAPLVPLLSTGLLLTAAGIYGVLAFAIARRSKALAVRVAIGATRRDVLQLVASQSLRLVAVGTICGVGGTFALSRVVRAAGGEGSFLDPDWTSFAAPAVILIVIGAFATWVPSRRALKVDPAILLRTT